MGVVFINYFNLQLIGCLSDEVAANQRNDMVSQGREVDVVVVVGLKLGNFDRV